jgi:uncharacterized protein YdbL (DUF1318 family)
MTTTIYVVTTRYDGGWCGGFYDKDKAWELADKLEEERKTQYKKLAKDGHFLPTPVEEILSQTKYIVVEREVQ